MKIKSAGFGTKAVHEGEGGYAFLPSSTPIYQTSTFFFDTVEDAADVNRGEMEGFVYTRLGNPTIRSFEAKLAALEQAEEAIAFSSGMAAISAVFHELLSPGDEVISSSHIYGGARGLFAQVLGRIGCPVRYFSPHENISDKIAELVNDRTRVIFFETPSNPELSVVDIDLIAGLAKKYHIFSVIDNTFATPYLQQPLPSGIDCVVHSATKYIGGHGDAIGGILAGSREFTERIRKQALLFNGECLSPFNAWLFLRGLKTLHLRMERHCSTAEALADFLSGQKKATAVLYPGLRQHTGHATAKRQMRSFGGVVSFTLQSRTACRRFLNNVRLCKKGVSLGDAETLVLNSALMFHHARTDSACRKIGINPSLIRISTGLEDAEDIIKDLEIAFRSV